MKKRLLSILLMCCMVLTLLPTTAFAEASEGDSTGHTCTGGTATCIKKAVCTICGQEYGELNPSNHAEMGTWEGNSTEHWMKYSCCGAVQSKAPHQGGTAICTTRALCSTCGMRYGETGAHLFINENVSDRYLKSAATCTEKAVYYKSCFYCGEKGTETFEYGDSLGHDYGAWTSNNDGTHTRICSRDASHTQTENCTGGTATCINKAVCTICGQEYGELDPSNHAGKKGSWESNSTEHWRTYSCCGAVINKAPHNGGTANCWSPATCETCGTTYGETGAHLFINENVSDRYLKSAATCTEKAVYYKSCFYCGEKGTETFEYGDSLGHDYGAWTSNNDGTHTRICSRDASHTQTENCTGGTADCTNKAVCEVCKGEYGDLASHNFTAETVDAKYLKSAATCTKKAVYYKSCTGCGEKGTETFEYGDSLGHDYGAWTSNNDGTHTRICSRDASHTQTENCTGGTADCTNKAVCEVCKGEYGDLASHNFTAETVDAKYLKSAATCTEKAVYYKSCTGCGLSSKGAASEATFESGNLLDHYWSEPSYTWTEVPDGFMCEAYSKCTNCDTDVSDIATVTYAVTKAPTCLNNGTGTYTATFSASGFSTQTKNVDLPATGHSWGDTEYIWTSTEDGYDCTAKHICKNDAAHEEHETVTATYSVITEPTCLKTGLGRYSASFAADWAAGSTKDVTLDALSHAYGAWTSNDDGTHTRICARNAEHTETGDCTGGTATCTTKAVCEVCKGEYGDLASHHFTAETVDAKYLKSAATCTEKAVYYKSCTDCGEKGTETFEDGNSLGHDYGAWTSNNDGTHTRVCARNAEHTETGDCTGGTATCTNRAVCEVCKAEYGKKDPENHARGCEPEWIATETKHEQKYSLCGKVTIAKESHTFGDWTIIQKPTSKRDGEKERICQVCQYKETKTIPATGSSYSYYTIKATAKAGGSISPSGNVSVREGKDQTFTITPDKGYAVCNVKIDGKSIGAVKSYTFENVNTTHTIEVIFMKANGNPQTGVFVDATGSYYEDAVDWTVENGIPQGTDDTHFSPDGICTRAQVVTFLWRAAGNPEPETRTMPFTDIPVGSYFYDAMLWAVENDITPRASAIPRSTSI